MKKEDVKVGDRVKFPNGPTGEVKKIGVLLIRIKLDNGETTWASAKEVEPA